MITGGGIRSAFASAHGDVLFLELSEPRAVEEYLLAHRLTDPGELPARIERAGDGNMNLTLRVSLGDRSLILKQGRPWVEKYDHIAAPWGRTLVEAGFYRAVAHVTAVASRMPRVFHVDEHHHVLVIEDLGTEGDYTTLYSGSRFSAEDLQQLLGWLSALAQVRTPEEGPGELANRAMRQLNHEHMFALPLRERNGLDLDRFTPGLGRAAEDLRGDPAYGWRVAELGEVYLSDGPSLVHGDYFPGSWIRTTAGIRIIDPEFCFFGAREFDYGVLLAHCAFAGSGRTAAQAVVAAAQREQLDETVVLGFAGVEIMRRLLGVAQLPLQSGLEAKRRLLEWSRSFVLAPERGVTCWR